MATNPQGAQINIGLTDYAHNIAPDYQKIIEEADFIAPRVVTGGSVGNFVKFESKANFEALDAARAYNGPRRREPDGHGAFRAPSANRDADGDDVSASRSPRRTSR